MIRAAAYCRVSTDKEDQLNSLESQKRFFYEYINRNLDWELADIYADEGITGTNTRKRYAFHRMLTDAQNHKFDLILTKEISRFARNTLDSIYYTRRLKEFGIGVIFLNDNINTMDADAELRLTILASIAQEESRKTSERVKWGQKRSMEQGVVFGRDLLGYDLKDGKLYVNEKGAQIVKLIFHKFVQEGKGTHVIARELNESGIPARGGDIWYGNVILRILKNEKYCGDLVQKKTYTPDYLKHEKKYNKGEEELIRIPCHHEPVISRELFEEAQTEFAKRRKVLGDGRKYSRRYCFSGLIRCGACGHSYVSRTKKTKGGDLYRYWRCYEAVQNGRLHTGNKKSAAGCNNRTVKEEELKLVLQDLIKNIKIDKQGVMDHLKKLLEKTAEDRNQEKDFIRINTRLKKLLHKKQALIDLYLSGKITKEDFEAVKQKYEKEIENLTKLADNDMAMQQGQGGNDTTVKESMDTGPDLFIFLQKILGGEEWNDAFFHNLIKQIVVEEDIKISEAEERDKRGDGINKGQVYNNENFCLKPDSPSIGITVNLKGTKTKFKYLLLE